MESEAKETKVYDDSDDEALLLVKGATVEKTRNKTYVKELATAISTVLMKHGVVRLRCIGKGAIGNAVYAHAIARGNLEEQGIDLRSSPAYQTVSFQDGMSRTAIVLELKDSVDLEEPEEEN